MKSNFPKILRLLKKHYPDAHCALNHKNAFELICATVLSAQCTDKRVNMVTPNLFKKFPDPESLSKATLSQIETMIKSTGFYKNKALSLKELAKALVQKHGGQVPQTMDELISLRGVGRKTANVILGTAFGKNVGVVVDTHVGRLSRRLGLTENKDPVKVEKDLMKIVPKKDWTLISHLLIEHGRGLCPARVPKCADCFLRFECPQRGV